MKQCWGEGELRAYVDCELPPVQAQELEAHLAECADCAAAHSALAARAGRVSSWMEDLSAEIPVAGNIPSRGIPSRAVWSAVAAIAAALILAAVLSKHPAPRAIEANVEPPAAPAAVEQPVVATAAPKPPRPTRRVPVRSVRQRPASQDYLALDDEPIDTGFVMRMAMPSGVLADVIVDGEGRARAIRTIHTSFKENHR